jgi:P pilus assembly chaperone PapD
MTVSMTHTTSSGRRGSAWTALVTLALAAAVSLPAAATAQVSVDELEIHMRLTPQHGAITQTIPVRNDEAKAQQVRVVVGDWVRDSLGNNMFLEAGSVGASCGQRLKVFPATLQVAPGATELVRVSYEPVPADTGCWSIVFIETVTPPTPRPDGQGSFLTIEIRTGVKIYVHRADAVALGEVQDMSVATAWRLKEPGTGSRDTTLVREASVRFVNSGTAHLRMRTSLEIRSAAGELLHTVDGPEAPMTPGATRIVRIAMPTLPAGDYIAIMLLDYGGDEIAAAQSDFKVP